MVKDWRGDLDTLRNRWTGGSISRLRDQKVTIGPDRSLKPNSHSMANLRSKKPINRRPMPLRLISVVGGSVDSGKA